MSVYHTPVLLAECLEALDIKSGRLILDGTLGGGGHSSAMAKLLAPDGFVIGLDQDPDALAEVAKNYPELNIKTWQGNFEQIEEAVSDFGLTERGLDGVLLDLGVSSHQLDTPNRGFADGPNFRS
jgi:16S rRNA (cytosine1402-N4)-methyltransferase